MTVRTRDDLSRLSMPALRERRLRSRRGLELAQLRARHPGGATTQDVELLRSEVDALTEELIRRYAADLDLVDSLLGAAYPHGGGSRDDLAEGGERT